jgi:DNA-binding Xre family transcriptional regulator
MTLAQAAGLRYATVNALYNGKTERVDFSILAAVLDGLNHLTGQEYTVGDLLEYTPAQEAETAAVLADHPDLLARVERLERGGEVRLIPLAEVAAKYRVKL